MMILSIVLFAAAFILMWIASELIIDGINHFTKRLHISSFAASFFLLGILTTIPELSVGINALIDKKPDIFVGDIIGASFVLFLLAIPVLAMVGNGIALSHQLTNTNLAFALFVIGAPVLFVMDGSLSRKDGIFLMILYVFLLYFVESKRGVLKKAEADILMHKRQNIMPLVKLIVGAMGIFVVGKILVDQTLLIAGYFNTNTYLLSLLVLSVGTNLPEFIIAINSILKKNKEIAFGDYLGSAAGNTFVFGLLVFLAGDITIENGNFFITFLLFSTALVVFNAFARSHRFISRREGAVLFILYLIFLLTELGM